MSEVVLGVRVGERTAGIVRAHGGGLVFGGAVDAGGGVILTDFAPHGAVVDGRLVVAGRLPPGAAAAVVIDDHGDAFVALLTKS
jgi:hypothetical protein